MGLRDDVKTAKEILSMRRGELRARMEVLKIEMERRGDCFLPVRAVITIAGLPGKLIVPDCVLDLGGVGHIFTEKWVVEKCQWIWLKEVAEWWYHPCK